MPKHHCRFSDYGKCTLPERKGEKCIGYEECEDYEEGEQMNNHKEDKLKNVILLADSLVHSHLIKIAHPECGKYEQAIKDLINFVKSEKLKKVTPSDIDFLKEIYPMKKETEMSNE